MVDRTQQARDEAKEILRAVARYARQYPYGMHLDRYGTMAADVMDGTYVRRDPGPQLLCRLGYLEYVKSDGNGTWWLTEKGRAAILKKAGLTEAQTVPTRRRRS